MGIIENHKAFMKKEFKMDIKAIKRYDKMAFMDAAEEIGLFDAE